MRARSEHHLFGLAGGDEPVVEGLDHWVEAHRGERRHVQRAAHRTTPTPDVTLASLLARVAIQRGQASELGGPCTLDRPELGHERQHDGAGHGTKTFDVLEALCLLFEVPFEVGVDVALEPGDLLVERLDHRCDAFVQHAAGARQAIFLRRAHTHQLRAPRHQQLQLLDLGRGWAKRDPGLVGLRRQRLRQVRQSQRVDGVGLRQMSHAARELPCRTRVNHRHGQTVTQQKAGQRSLQAASGFHNDETNTKVLERFEQRLKPRLVVGHGMGSRYPVHRPLEHLLGHIYANELQRLRRRLTSVCHIPSLQHAKWLSGNCSGLATNARTCTPTCLATSFELQGATGCAGLANQCFPGSMT